MKIMFDSNAFSELLKSHIQDDLFFDKCKENIEFYITDVQKRELSAIPDEYKRNLHLECLNKMNAKLVGTVAILGFGRLGECVLGEGGGDAFDNILIKTTQSNENDAMIAAVAEREGCTIITDDTKFINKLAKEKIPTMTFKDFLEIIFE